MDMVSIVEARLMHGLVITDMCKLKVTFGYF